MSKFQKKIPDYLSVNRVINLNITQKTVLLLCVLIAPQILQYFGYAFFVGNYNNTPGYFDTEYLLWLSKVILYALGVIILCIISGLYLIKKGLSSKAYSIISLITSAIILCFCGHQIGMIYAPTGLVLMVFITIGLILFDVYTIAIVTGVATSSILFSFYGAALGFLNFSPILKYTPVNAGTIDIFWVNSIVFFSAPYVFIGFYLASVYIKEWRIRERQVTKLSLIDPLTEVHNRRSILNILELEIERRMRFKSDLESTACIMVDLDYFKNINDTYGHQAGDAVLSDVAKLLQKCIRKTDSVGRYGGEEFIILLPNTSLKLAYKIADRCCKRLRNHNTQVNGSLTLKVTASFGVSSNEKNPNTLPHELINIADKALYQAKDQGRNQVVVHVNSNEQFDYEKE